MTAAPSYTTAWLTTPTHTSLIMQTLHLPAPIAAAIVAASHAINAMKADAKNDHFGNEYISLTAITERAKAAMKAHNVTILHSANFNTPYAHEGPALQASVTVQTIALHDTGEAFAVEVTLPISKMDPQAGAGAITYGRRIGIAMLLGIVVDEDDDGNTASGRPSDPRGQVHRAATTGPAGTSMRGFTTATTKPAAMGARVKMPFGRTKEQFIDELPDSEVESAIAWAESKGKFVEFVRDAKRYLASKSTHNEPEPTQDDPDDNLPF